MAPSLATRRRPAGTELVREHLLTALHLGQLAPGDRVVSVRRLADLTGVNRKTVHRAYRQLTREGVLEPRPGAGTFVADTHAIGGGQGERELMRAVNRCRADALALGMPPESFAAFLTNYLGDGLRDLPIAVVECNDEQIGLIASQLQRDLRISPRSLRLESLVRSPQSATAGSFAIVTTDCHRREVSEAATGTGLPIYRVALDSSFPQRVLQVLQRSQLVMVVGDVGFDRVFRQLLAQTGASPEHLLRLQVVDVRGARAALRRAGSDSWAWVSPRTGLDPDVWLDGRAARLSGSWSIPPRALDRLRVAMACDLAIRHAPSA